jgi:tRNA-binding protein
MLRLPKQFCRAARVGTPYGAAELLRQAQHDALFSFINFACMISWADFEQVDIRVGTIVEAREFPEARRPAYQLVLDFGPEIGRKKTSAQLTHHYQPATLLGRQVLAVVNFPPKQIGPFRSEVLVLGAPDADGHTVLAAVAAPVPNGSRLH